MQKNLLLGLTLFSANLLNAQWNPNPTENNLVVSIAQKGTGQVSTPSAVSDGAGGMFIVWMDGRNSATTNNDIFLTRILSDGTIAPGFAAGGNPICTAAGAQSNPVMTEDGQGGVVISWTDQRQNNTNNSDIYAQRVNSAGTALWTADGVAIAANPANETAPTITLTSTLEVAIVWRFLGNGLDLAFNYVALSNGAKSLASDIVIVAEPNSQTGQQVIGDGNGGMIVVWSDGRTTNGTAGIVAQRYNAGGIPSWTAGGLFVRAPGGSNSSAPQLVSDGAGGAVFAWSDSRNGGANADIYVQRINAAGDPEWTVNGIQATDATGQQLLPTIVRSNNIYIVGWLDQRNGATNNDVYTQAFSATGVKLWNDGNAVTVVSEPGNQPLASTAPAIIADELGGAVFIFDDRRNGDGNDDINAQYISAAGVKQWEAAGVPIATRTASNQIGPFAVAGLNNSVIVGWRDSRSGTTNAELYASKLMRDGTLPVTLLEVGATLLGKTVQVQWTTTSEYNLAHYEVERSIDGNSFANSGTVKARNTPGVHQYSLLDNTPVSGNNFYRIKSVNTDGSYKFSEIVKVQVAYLSDKSVQLYPNPVVAGLNLRLNDLPLGYYQVRIVDNAGRNIESHRIQKSTGTQIFQLESSRLSQGMYRVQVINDKGETVSVQALMKR
jgi:hypothetical protein